MTDKKRDAATEATDSGVKLNLKAINSQCENTPKPPISTMSEYAKPGHKSVARALSFVLTLGTRDAWWALVAVLRARLTVNEQACLAFVALKALDHDTAIMAAEAALCVGAGMPIAPLFSNMDEAAFWADMASSDELEAYAVACFNAMSPRAKADFLDYTGRRAV